MYGQFDAGSQKLLDNAERYALYLAEALDDDDRQRRVWQTNNMGEHVLYM
jgi:DNA-binding phage protein